MKSHPKKLSAVSLLALGLSVSPAVAQTSTSSSDATRQTAAPVTPSSQDPDQAVGSGDVASPVDPAGRPIDRGSGQNPSRINSASRGSKVDNSRPQTDALGAPARGFDEQFRQREAEDFIGKQVRNAEGDEMGQIRDLIIDAQNGQIRYVVVSSGGVLGIGGTRRAVPANALNPADDDGNMTLAVESTLWEQAPQFREDELATLAQENRGREIYEHFGQTWDSARAPTKSAGSARSHLLLVSQLDDKQLRSGERTIGEVDEVLVDWQDRTASVLVEVEDGFLESEHEEFVIGFSQINVSGSGRDLALTTDLSAADFESAGTNSAAGRLGRPYVWSDDDDSESTRTSVPADAAKSHPNSGLARAQEGANYGSPDPDQRTPSSGSVGAISGGKRTAEAGDASARAQAEAVRQALRQDSKLGDSVRRVDVAVRDDALVLTGEVATRDEREQIVKAAQRAAAGRDVKNELTVREVAE